MEPDHIHQDKKDGTGATAEVPNIHPARSHIVQLPQPYTESRSDKIGKLVAKLERCAVDTLELTPLPQIVPKNAPYPGQPIDIFQVIAKNG
jgi:hypothetical protein